MKLVEGWKAVAVRRAGEVEEVAVEFRRSLRRDVLDSDQRQRPVGTGLVHHRLGTAEIDRLVLDQRTVHVVDSHGAAGDAAGAGDRRIALGEGDRHVLEAVIGAADVVGERVGSGKRSAGCGQQEGGERECARGEVHSHDVCLRETRPRPFAGRQGGCLRGRGWVEGCRAAAQAAIGMMGSSRTTTVVATRRMFSAGMPTRRACSRIDSSSFAR